MNTLIFNPLSLASLSALEGSHGVCNRFCTEGMDAQTSDDEKASALEGSLEGGARFRLGPPLRGPDSNLSFSKWLASMADILQIAIGQHI